MARTVGIGIQSFEKLITENIFYTDKTDFIRQWWENRDDVTLITRPRRFGKTLNMNMLERFLSIEYTGRGEVFKGLSIWKDEKYRNLQGTYPVIFLSFAGIKSSSFDEAKKGLLYLIEKLYNRYEFLLKEDSLNEKEKEQYHIGRLRLLVGLLCLFVTAVLLLDGVYGLSGFFTIILLPVVLAVVVLANTWAKKR